MDKLKVGLLGLGRVADHHKNYLAKNKYLKVTACCDTDKTNLKKFSIFYKSKNNFLSINDFAKSKTFDLAIISTPSGLHSLHSKILITNKKHVLVEKPAALKVGEHLKLYKLAKRKKVFYDVILQNRLNKAIVFLKKLLTNNQLGKILKVNVRVNWCRYQSYYQDKWHGKWKMDGGVICQQAYHHIDILSFLFPEIKSIYAERMNLQNKLQAEDSFVTICKLKNDILLTFEATTAIRPKDHEASVIVYGTKGYAEIGGIAMNSIKNLAINRKFFNIKKYNENFKTGYGNSHSKVFDTVGNKILKKNLESINKFNEVEKTLSYIHNFYSASEIEKKIKFSKNKKFKFLE